MNYSLNTQQPKKSSALGAFRQLFALIPEEKKRLSAAFFLIILNSGFSLAAPLLIGRAVDKYVVGKNYHGVLVYSALVFAAYLATLVSGYFQTMIMGGVGQRMLYALRNAVFTKIQQLPVAFFGQNKAGDLISRINNDTDKLNTFFSQSLVQFIGSISLMIGAGIFLISLNPKLGMYALIPAAFILVFTRLVSPWVKKKNATSLKSTGGLSAEIQESIDNFKVIVAFNRRDYFRNRFAESNNASYDSAVRAGIANNIFTPVYGFGASAAQLITLSVGIYLIATGAFTIGLLISFLAYVTSFYTPLRQLAAMWASLQTALAGWDRIVAILNLKSDLEVLPETESKEHDGLLAFDGVSFEYENGKKVLANVTLTLEKGKTYALIGPTGGGKTTTASLMARLYDPTAGTVYLNGKDIRSYEAEERTKKIGFILQEPFLFGGTLAQNIVYGNSEYESYSSEQLLGVLQEMNLDGLLERFDNGIETTIVVSGDAVSLGQKQLIAFIRAVLRKPELLILDEATANIDTVTEELLETILNALPKETMKVIIAHRLNTIANADTIFFVNDGAVTNAGTMEQAVNMLMHGKRKS